MAEKIIIDIQLNDNASNKTLNELKANLKSLKDQIGGVSVGSDAFNKLSSEIAKTNIQIKEINKGFSTVAADATHASNSIKGMEDHLKELKAQINTVGVGTKEFKDLQSQILKVDTNLKNTKKSIEGLDVEALAGHIGKLGGGITASFTAVSAVIGKGNADIEKFTANIVTGIAISNGIKGATEAWTSAQKLLNIAMAANPIGVMVAGIAALAGGIAYLLITLDDTTEEQLALNAAQQQAKTIMADYELQVANLNVELAKIIGNYEDIKAAELDAFNKKQIKELDDLYTTTYNNLKENSAEFQDALEKETELKGDINSATKLIALNEAKLATETRKGFRDGYENGIKLNKQRLDAAKSELTANQDKISKLINEDAKYAATVKGIEEKQTKEKEIFDAKQIKDEQDKNKKLTDERIKYIQFVRETELNLFQLISDISLNTRKLLIENGIKIYENSTKLNEEEIKALEASGKKKITIGEDYNSFYEKLNKELIANKMLAIEQMDIIEIESLKESYQAELDNQQNILATKIKGTQEYSIISDKIKKLEQEQLTYISSLEKVKQEKREETNKKMLSDTLSLYKELAIENKKLMFQLVGNQYDVAENVNKIALKQIEDETDKTLKKYNINKEVNDELLRDSYKYFHEQVMLTDKLQSINDKSEKEKIRIQLKTNEKTIDSKFAVLKEDKNISYQELLVVQETYMKKVGAQLDYNDKHQKLVEDFLNKQAELQAKYDAEDLQRQITHLDKQAGLYEKDIARAADINKEKNDLILNQNINTIYKTQEQLFKALDEEAKKKILTEEEVATEKKRIEDDTLRAVDDLKAENRKKNKDLDIKTQEELGKIGLDLLDKFQEAQLNGVLNRINTEYNAQANAFQEQETALAKSLDNSLITQSEYTAQLKLIEVEKTKAELKQRQDTAKAQKAAALVQIAIETAVAITKAAGVIPFSPVLIAIAAATGAAQGAVVASQPIPTYSKGGILNGPSHAEGGIPIYQGGGQIAEAEGGEIILNKNVSKIPALTAMASMINVSTGGKAFTANPSSISSNSALTATVDPMVIQSIVNSTVKGIAAIPVQNVATQTTRVSRRVENVEASARY